MSGTASSTCPNGHQSSDPDWCDTCGAPMAGPSAAAVAAAAPASTSAAVPASSAAATTTPVPCPHCGEINAADNLFCESCGYDFTTGQAPEPQVGAIAVPVAAVLDGAAPDGDTKDGSHAGTGGPDAEAPDVVASGSPVSAGTTSQNTPAWIIVVEVDPMWHAIKGELADRPLPPPSTSTVPLFQHTSLIGRTSQSRGLRPEVALDVDTAVSRRHAQLLVEGDQLSVVDLSSTNGTYVLHPGHVPDADTTPLASGVSTALADGDRIFLGAWSRLTVRRA